MSSALPLAGRLVSVVLLGLAFASLNIRPAGQLDFMILGSPLTLSLSGATLIVALLVALTCVGAEEMVRTHPWLRDAPLAYTAIFWPLPAIITLSAALLVPALYGKPLWIIGLIATFIGLAVVLIVQYQGIDPAAHTYDRARLFITLIAYGSAFFLYAAVAASNVRSILLATTIFLVTLVLAVTLLRGAADQWRPVWIYAVACGMVVGELTWALSYWPIGPVGTAALLLLTFYVMTGLSQHALQGRLSRRVVAEFLLVGALLFAVVLRMTPWLG